MLTTLALTLAPVVAPAQGGADLHPSDVGVFFEIPDPQAFAEAWKGGAIPGLLTDESLAGLYELFELGGIEDLLEQLPPEVERDVLPILRGVDGLSVSLQLDLSDLEAQITEGAVVYGILEDLDTLFWETFWVDLDEDGNPPSLDELGIAEELLVDPFGNRYQLEWTDDMGTWTCLGSDGVVGGTGLAADWTSDAEFGQYVASRVLGVVGVELAVKWVDETTAAQMANMLSMVGLMDQEMGGEVPVAEILDMNGDAPELADLYRLNPVDLGMPPGDMVEVSLQHHGRTTLITLGTISGERVHALGQAAAAGAASPDSLAGAGRYDSLIAKVHEDEGVALWQGAVLGFQGVPTEGTVADTLGNLAALFEFFGFHGAGSAWQTRIVDGSYHGHAVRPAMGMPREDLTAAMARIPEDAVFAQVGTMDPAAFWGYLQEISTGEEELLAMLGEEGIDVQAGLMENLGRTFTVWMEPVRSLAPPQVHVVLPVRDGELLMATLDGLVDFVAGLEDSFRVSHRAYRGSALTVLDVGIPIGFSPSYAIVDGHLWLSNSSTLVKRRIRAASKGEVEEGGAHPYFAGIDTKDLQGAMYFDLGSLMGAYYSTGRAFAGMIPADAGLPPGLAGELPEPDLFERHFRPETVLTRFEGDELHTY